MFKECFVTIGATAKFPELIQAALAPDSLEAFVNNGFTRLNLQCGESFDSFESFKPTNTRGLEIKAFGFNMNGLSENMRACQAQKDVSMKGLVICHAGAGTILDAMRLGLSLIVVPNVTLLDNHQDELAAELESQGYVTKSDTCHLAQAISIACKKEQKAWGGHNASFSNIVDEVVGYEDDTRGRLD